MKVLKYILFIILGLIVLFFVMGLLKSTVSYGHKITVDKPLKEAWAVHQDLSKLGLWLKGFKSIDLVSGEKGQVGSQYKVIVKPSENDPDFEMIETIESKKDFDHMRLSFDSDMMKFDQNTSFSDVDGKTVIETDSNVKGKGIFMRSLFAVMEMFTGTFSTQEQQNLESLKKVIEENTTDYYPAPIVPETILEEVVE